MISAVEFKRRGDPGFLQLAGEKFCVFSHVYYLWIGGSCFSVTQRKIGVCEADRSSVELLIYVVQKPWEPKRSRDGSDALEGWNGGVAGLAAACDLLRCAGPRNAGLSHAGPEAEQACERITHKHPIRWRIGELRLSPGDDLVDKGIERFLGTVAKVGTLSKNAWSTPGREVLFPQLNTNVYQANACRYLNGGVVGHVSQEVDNGSSGYRRHPRVDRKLGDDRFSRHGVGGVRGCVDEVA